MTIKQTRRRFLTNLSLAGAAALLGAPRALAANGPLETTAVRFMRTPSICHAPQFIVEDLVRAEGFTDIRYIEGASSAEINEALVRGKVDFNTHFAPQWVSAIDGGGPITILGGVHVGCFELFGKEGIRSISDLKGKSVGVTALGSSDHLFVSIMAAHIGLDPVNDIHWITSQSPAPAELFAEGKIDACLGLPPVPQDLRARHVGHVVVNSAMDRPWSQYFCCMLAGNRDYVQTHPVATKRVLRAIMKATDLCTSDPTAAAQRMVSGGFTPRYDYALQTFARRAIRQMAGIRRRGHDPVLRTSVARIGLRQVHSAEDHRRRHRLALFQRGQARIEGVSV
jgi:NitT/TauT family transport system substrate-binding protein